MSSVTFNTSPFAEGRFRNAYLGTWEQPWYKQGQKCVVKKRKDTYTWKPTDWDTTERIHKKAQQLAEGFNNYSNCDRSISFKDVTVMRVTRADPNLGLTPKLDEYVIVEDYIPGDFKKWCNNYGYISQEAQGSAIMMPAFMHWSWVYTGGETMIADLQGVRTDTGYTLTDPVILSVNGGYGVTDMGVEGMAMFFLHHVCNSFCNTMPKPTVQDFTGKIPALQMYACNGMLQQLSSSTSYTCELQFSAHVRTLIAQTFRTIAARW